MLRTIHLRWNKFNCGVRHPETAQMVIRDAVVEDTDLNLSTLFFLMCKKSRYKLVHTPPPSERGPYFVGAIIGTE